MRKLSVCPSVKRVDCGKTKESSVHIFYTIWKKVYPSFPTRKMVGGGRPLVL